MDDLELGATIKGFSPGQIVFARYTLNRILGRGGMGVVWLARDDKLERDVALKFLPEVMMGDKLALADLKRETRRSLDLTHPHIVRIYDFVDDARAAAIAMEFISGETLTNTRVDRPGHCYEPADIARWVGQLCAALDYAHTKAKVVHRDLKPANLMIDAAGDLKVTDFGIATSISDSVSRVSKQAGSSGTPVYMSPQQMMGEKPAVTDDIYAFGATLYELLTGKPPFYAGNILLQVQSKTAPSLAERRAELGVNAEIVPAEWEETIAACLAKEPSARPQSAGEVAERLGLAAKGSTQRPTPNAERLTQKSEPRTERAAPSAPGSNRQSEIVNRKSKAPLYAGLGAGVLLLGGLGWYLGVHAPGQKRLAEEQARLAENARLEGEVRAAEALKLKNEQQHIAAELRERQERERKEDAIRQKAAEAEAARLAAARGGIIVRTNPSGAELQVGSVAIDKSPLTLKDQKLGKYPVRVRLDGYEDWSGEVEVKENEFVDVDVALVRSTGRVILTGPTGAEVTSGGRRLGVLPLTLDKVPTGKVSYAVKLKGYQTSGVGGEVVRNSDLRLEATLDKTRAPETGRAYTIADLNLTLQPISPGMFSMGSASGESDNERPVTRVTLSQPFWLGKTEVTQAQWAAVMGSNPSNFKNSERPVENVSWNDAMEFCRKLTERERAAGRLPADYAYTLPTEAQWEYACRAGTTGNHAGNLDTMGWYDGNSGNQTQPVGMKQANAWGLHDMHGNVWEWCADWFEYYFAGNVTDPRGPPSGSYRILRGGSSFDPVDECRSANRNYNGPDKRAIHHGFRLALVSIKVAVVANALSRLGSGENPEASSTSWTIPDLDLVLMTIAPGTFQMGSASGGRDAERPVTRVTITKPFWLGKTEVTQAQWSMVIGSNPSQFHGSDRPVERVSWVEAMEFCRRLTERERIAGRLPEGYIYTLPTEAQWEYACRAGTTGDHAGHLDAMGWYDKNSGSETHPVGQKKANAWGLHDMHGNVWEWCADRYGSYPAGSVTDPGGAVSGYDRVGRGGGWGDDAAGCRSTVRDGVESSRRGKILGFRLALAPVP